jgi:hypothetical protein
MNSGYFGTQCCEQNTRRALQPGRILFHDQGPGDMVVFNLLKFKVAFKVQQLFQKVIITI